MLEYECGTKISERHNDQYPLRVQGLTPSEASVTKQTQLVDTIVKNVGSRGSRVQEGKEGKDQRAETSRVKWPRASDKRRGGWMVKPEQKQH